MKQTLSSVFLCTEYFGQFSVPPHFLQICINLLLPFFFLTVAFSIPSTCTLLQVSTVDMQLCHCGNICLFYWMLRSMQRQPRLSAMFSWTKEMRASGQQSRVNKPELQHKLRKGLGLPNVCHTGPTPWLSKPAPALRPSSPTTTLCTGRRKITQEQDSIWDLFPNNYIFCFSS